MNHCQIIRRNHVLLPWMRKRLHSAPFCALFADRSLSSKEQNQETVFDEAQAKRLLQTYGNAILRLAYSYVHNFSDAEELLQDTLMQFLKAGPAITSSAHEKAWLLHTAANLSKNRIAYNRIRETDELSETLAAAEERDLSFVWDAVKSLPPHYREVIHLCYYEGCQTSEAAKILGRKESTVRSDLRRGREKLKKILKEVYDFDESL